MALVDVDLPIDGAAMPAEVARYVAEAGRRIERFVETRLDRPISGFVPSDYPLVYAALRSIAEARAAPGHAFCEWGSGFGVVGGLAAMLGFDACGIEIDPDLVLSARRLADDFDLPVDFAEGSFIPAGGDRITDALDNLAWLDLGGGDAHEQLGLDPDDFDVIFAYPWPGESGVIAGLFDRYATVGALLVTYEGLEGVRVQRKVARASCP